MNNARSTHWDQTPVAPEADLAAFDELPLAVRRVIAECCVPVNSVQVFQQWKANKDRPDFRLEHFVLFIAHHEEETERNCMLWDFHHTEPFQHPLLRALRKVQALGAKSCITDI